MFLAAGLRYKYITHDTYTNAAHNTRYIHDCGLLHTSTAYRARNGMSALISASHWSGLCCSQLKRG